MQQSCASNIARARAPISGKFIILLGTYDSQAAEYERKIPAFDVGFIAKTINVHRDSEPICRVRYYGVTASLRVELARRRDGGEGGEKTA